MSELGKVLACMEATAPRSVIATTVGPISIRERHGDGPPLVLLHGIGGNSGVWWQQYGAFDRRVIGWDAPGYGGSFDFTSEQPTVEEYASAFVALLEAMKIQQAVVAGHSLGALIAACVTALFPSRVKRLILAAASSGHASYDKEKREQMLRSRLGAFSEGNSAAYARARVANLLSPRPAPDVVEQAVRLMAQIKQPGFPQAARMVSATDIFAYLHRIAAPTRVICGTADRVTPPDLNRKIAGAIRGAEFETVDGAGHWLFLEFAGGFNRLVRRFIQ